MSIIGIFLNVAMYNYYEQKIMFKSMLSTCNLFSVNVSFCITGRLLVDRAVIDVIFCCLDNCIL